MKGIAAGKSYLPPFTSPRLSIPASARPARWPNAVSVYARRLLHWAGISVVGKHEALTQCRANVKPNIGWTPRVCSACSWWVCGCAGHQWLDRGKKRGIFSQRLLETGIPVRSDKSIATPTKASHLTIPPFFPKLSIKCSPMRYSHFTD